MPVFHKEAVAAAALFDYVALKSTIEPSSAAAEGQFTWEYADSTVRARHIATDTGWKILLDRGLDIFQPYEMNDAFSLANRLQEHRGCKAFEITYIREDI
jgi:ATP-dependent Lon protease